MKIILICYFIITTNFLIKAQSITPGLYVNKNSNEFICFSNDSMQFRIYNYDALSTFSICNAKYDVHKKGKYHIHASKSIFEQTSKIDRLPRNDSSIAIKVFYNDSMPIKFANVFIKDTKRNKNGYLYATISDENGQVTFSEKQINSYSNKKILIQIETLGFSTKKRVIIEEGYNYIIQSIIPETYPFTVFKRGKILINRLNAKEIEVEICRSAKQRKRSGKTKLIKVDANFRCTHSLFDKDISNFNIK